MTAFVLQEHVHVCFPQHFFFIFFSSPFICRNPATISQLRTHKYTCSGASLSGNVTSLTSCVLARSTAFTAHDHLLGWSSPSFFSSFASHCLQPHQAVPKGWHWCSPLLCWLHSMPFSFLSFPGVIPRSGYRKVGTCSPLGGRGHRDPVVQALGGERGLSDSAARTLSSAVCSWIQQHLQWASIATSGYFARKAEPEQLHPALVPSSAFLEGSFHLFPILFLPNLSLLSSSLLSSSHERCKSLISCIKLGELG